MLMKISQIKVRENWNIRKFNETDCEKLKKSIEEIGLQHPIVVNEKHELVSGHRRLCSCKALGWTEIPATVISFANEAYERLAHIDENLLTKTFSERELEKALSEKKRIYELIYPQSTKRGPRKDDEVKSFAKDTADKTGMSEREIRKLTRRVDEVTPWVREHYENFKITSTQVDELARLTMDLQNKVLPKVIGISVAETKLIVDDLLKKEKAKELANSESKKQKKEKTTEEIIIDERAVEMIMDCERTIRAIEGAIQYMEIFARGKKHIFLDDIHFKKLRDKVESLAETTNNFLISLGETD